MQFNEYRSLRNQFLSSGKRYSNLTSILQKARRFSSADFRRLWTETASQLNDRSSDLDVGTCIAALGEDIWVDNERPFYNVWPIAVELAKSVKLDLPFSAANIPFAALLLRFAKGHEPFGVRVAMLVWPGSGVVQVHAYFGDEWHRAILKYVYKPQQKVQEWLDAGIKEQNEHPEMTGLLIRLCVFISLLVSDHDMITPVVLSRDQNKYESTDDPTAKKWLEDRATRRMGRGFDVCKSLDLQRAKSPHWRNPHFALFWTGEGRHTPILKMRSGSIVQRVSMADVPTGYLGPETDADDEVSTDKTPRDSISKSRRFNILKRDGFRCRLCGSSQSDGAKLHVDHRTPLAKGGSNEDENLWTLCERCNLGKSTKDV